MEALRRSAQTASSSGTRHDCSASRLRLPSRCASGAVSSRAAVVRGRGPHGQRTCSRGVAARAAAAEEDLEEGAAGEQEYPMLQNAEMWDREQFMGDNSYAIHNKYNEEPDFNDPEWHKKVTDWGEFW